ncbi:Putative odorant receptor 30a [Habropoda laboriosa]|uniref:Odorant receptor n=1 Tax=Habropoda laboriosa TaxID=597456 RepID=A0A0L7QLK2_9HYME|nr:Putative odorant receptor 30a [Habropoda laboriosa]
MHLVQSKDISIVWSFFLMKIVGLWLAADEAEQRRRNFALIYTLNAIFIASCIAMRDIYYSWGNVNDCIYVGCNILYLAIVFFKILVLYKHRIEFYGLIRFTQEKFWHFDYNSREKLILSECKKICTVFIVAFSFCTQGTCAGYVVTPILANVGKNQSERMLPFNMWVDFPTGLSPYYEVLFIIQTLCVYHVGICYMCFDNILSLLNLHVATQFRILQYRFMNLSNVIEKQTDGRELEIGYTNFTVDSYLQLKSCVQYHQALTGYCKKLENIFSLLVLGQVLFLAMTDSPPSRNVGLVLNLAGTLCQLFMFTYSCDGLTRESMDVSRAVFARPWANLPMDRNGKSVRQSMLMVIMRSNRCCCLTASGFFPVSLETYTGVIN